MLKTVWLTRQRNTESGTAMLLGGFDGLHIGHRRLLERANQSGLPVGIMTIAGGKSEKNLFTFLEREEIFREVGIDFVFELPFSEIKDLSPEAFINLLKEEFNPKLFVCGEDFCFGAGGLGKAKTLKQGGQVCVEIQSLVEIDGEKVASGVIKKLLAKGEIEKANGLLGEAFFLKGEVFKDRQIGRTIGFPTANVLYPQEKFPLKEGVYETATEVDGVIYKGITNYGARPTFDEQTVLTETYLDGFSGDLYCKTLKIRFIRFLREIKKFKSVDDLKEQLEKDIKSVRR